VDQYLVDKGLRSSYVITDVMSPSFEWIANEVIACHDIVVLLGFWEEQDGQPVRLGGHYVTVPGVDIFNYYIGFSDPWYDRAETQAFGQYLPPIHPHAGEHVYTLHNNPVFLSHDVYTVTLSGLNFAGNWEPESYAESWDEIQNFAGANVPTEYAQYQGQYAGGQIFTKVEFAVAVGPSTPQGTPTPEPSPNICSTLSYKGEGYPDYALNGVPDFDQRQEDWKHPQTQQWSHDAATASANALWWYDSKYESEFVLPPAINDTFPLIQAYGEWDDHDPRNVAPLIEDLSWRMDTNGQRTGGLHLGTTISDTVAGLESYIASKGLDDKFFIDEQRAPTFEWVTERITICNNVILLVGIWEDQQGEWKRIGGRYVTATGVDWENWLLALSDPFRDNVEAGFPGWAKGLHWPHEVNTFLHNDAYFRSWDAYWATFADNPGGAIWGLGAFNPTLDEIQNFAGLNFPFDLEPYRGEHKGGEVVSVIDWAIAIRPEIEDPEWEPAPIPTPTPPPTPTPTPTPTPVPTPTLPFNWFLPLLKSKF